ncbi:MAG TPA: ROK family protein, partial [Solirubrobacterales bacterium]|nr:ROK family protein [Solirubrobacterales bacterium]
MHRQTIARIIDALVHGERRDLSPAGAEKLKGWVEEENGRAIFGHRCGSIIGISIKRESIAWVIAGIPEPVTSGRIDAPILPLQGEPATLEELEEHLVAALQKLVPELPSTKLGAVGVAWPGLVDGDGAARDYPTHHSLLGDSDANSNPSLTGTVAAALQRVGLSPDPAEPPEIAIVNDADADLLHEARRGIAKGVASALGVKVCGGIGMSLLSNRQLIRGSNWSSGDIEHIRVELGEDRDLKKKWGRLKDLDELDECACTGSQCVGRFASGAAIVEQLSGYFPKRGMEREMTPNERGRRIESEANKGPVTAVCGRAGRLLGQALLAPTLAFDPEMIVVSAFPHNDHLRDGIRTRLT